MGKRSYDQFCALARSLDIIGQRWTLLVIRELLTGPKRFKNLMENLPGIGTNLLTNRLKLLEEKGIIKRVVLPPPAEVSAYDLTEWGRGLEDVIISIVSWGSPLLDRGVEGDYVRASWAIVGLKSLFNSSKVKTKGLTCQFIVEEESFWAKIDQNGKLITRQGVLPVSDIELQMDLSTLSALGSGELDLVKGIDQGAITFSGTQDDLDQFFMPFEV